MKGFPPQCFLIGAQKAGTTYLASLLDQNPEVQVSNPKETDFFTGRIYPRGMSWYRQCFSDDVENVLIDASTSYSAAFPLSDPRGTDLEVSFNGVAERIKKISPDAKFIYILRNPVKRTYSAYWHFVRAGIEKRSFHEVVAGQDSMSEYYLLLSDYAVQLEHYFGYFDKCRIKIILFEEFIKDPKKTVNSCFEFLNVNLMPEISLNTGTHKSYQYTGVFNKVNQFLAQRGGLRPILGKLKKALPEALVRQGMKVGTTTIPSMASDDLNTLTNYFMPRIEKLEELLDCSLLNVWFEK